jgi:hypothetical protein
MSGASSEARERASTAILCGIISVICLYDDDLPPGGQMLDASDAWLLTLKRLRREQNTAEAAVARKTQEHQCSIAMEPIVPTATSVGSADRRHPQGPVSCS